MKLATQLRRFAATQLEPVDAASLVLFRIMFGCIAALEAWHFLRRGWIGRLLTDPEIHFHFPGFGWLPSPSELPMEGVFYLLLVAAIAMVLGVASRVAAATLALGWSYVFLSDAANYLNHKYLLCVLALLLAVVPAGAHFNVLRRPVQIGSVPRWAVAALRVQVAFVYVYAGIAKLNGDWLAGRPLDMWLAEESDFPLLGPLFAEGSVAIAFAWAGTAIDLAIVPLILWRKTRWFALAIIASFHALNSSIFEIGLFPLTAMACTLTLLPPEWPRSIFRLPARSTASTGSGRAAMGITCCVLLVQFVLPTRHWFIPGDVHWTEEGHWFAWHMKLRDKRCAMSFRVFDGIDMEDFDARAHLSFRQSRAVAGNPELVRQLAVEIADLSSTEGRSPAVYADVECSLNGGPRGLLVDPEVDLAAAASGAPAAWILPRPLGP